VLLEIDFSPARWLAPLQRESSLRNNVTCPNLESLGDKTVRPRKGVTNLPYSGAIKTLLRIYFIKQNGACLSAFLNTPLGLTIVLGIYEYLGLDLTYQ